ncbi:hypothetical protein SG26_20265 (plasmid) [Haloarcula sp. CBA1115]|uniref:hypothetical protein n=1 Tax=unclassified Haloarcula TaxID=2624677 RepID=UPI0005955895|nr:MULTISPECIES: hypothetical protein [unclassified Haloarcula]AJF28077.1 hypothetical protein SG26_20265 [Haloarcula sp. CBA1115]
MGLNRQAIEDKIRVHGIKAALIGGVFTIAVFGFTYLLPFPFSRTISFIGVAFSLSTGSASTYLSYQTEQRERDNEEFGRAAKAVEEEREARDERDEAQADLREYQRMIRILEDRDVDLAKLIDNQTESSQIALLVFRDQEAPEDHDYYQTENENNQNKFLRYRTMEEYGGDTISSFTWMLPPSVVAEEGLEDATRNELKQWFLENIYDYYGDEEFQANVLMMGLMDVSSIFSITKEATKLGKFAENLIEYDDGFTEEDFYEALAEERVNMLEEVKSGRLVFFLPDSLSKDTVDVIRNHSEVVKSDLTDGGLRELAAEESVKPLTEGFQKLDVPQPEELASEVVEEAQMWKKKISEA